MRTFGCFFSLLLHWSFLLSWFTVIDTPWCSFDFTVMSEEIVMLWRTFSLLWRHYGCGSVTNHRRLDCILNRLFRRSSKKTAKLRVTGLCEGNSVTGEFTTQRASNAEDVSFSQTRYGIVSMGVWKRGYPISHHGKSNLRSSGRTRHLLRFRSSKSLPQE